ncbi:MAG: hypothetical protein H7144_14300 [Burkholderiales bacterium]|nr:hypothetical protein [Phycisphaerae bacterium]
MRYRAHIPVLGILAIAGCGGDGTTAPPDTVQQQASVPFKRQSPPSAPPSNSQSNSPSNSLSNSAAPTPANTAPRVQAANIPAGARYAIVCERYSGGGHEQQARLAKDGLIRQTGRSDFHVVHEPQSSLLMYGYYAEVESALNPREATRAKTDREWLETLKNSMGDRLFRQCMAIVLPSPNPDAPPEWDLTKLDSDRAPSDPTRRHWTIVIAAYTPKAVDERGRPLNQKQLAIETVRDARAQGVEAYYYLGDEMSQVCIGAWPRSAIKAQERAAAETAESGRTNSNKELYVSTTPLSAEARRTLEKSGKYKVFAPKLEVQNPDLLRTWQKFKEYAVDGYVKVDKETNQPQESFLAEIPKTQTTMLSGTPDTSATEQAAPTVINPIAPNANTGGRLRRVTP